MIKCMQKYPACYASLTLFTRGKLKKLKQDYKKIKDHNNRSGSDWWTSKWFDRLDALLGHRPAFSDTAATIDLATALLETLEDREMDNVSTEGTSHNVSHEAC